MNFFQILEKYLIDKNGGYIFVESKGLSPKEKLSEKTRRHLVNHLVDFMRHFTAKKSPQSIKLPLQRRQ